VLEPKAQPERKDLKAYKDIKAIKALLAQEHKALKAIKD
jgi:hypothetical protein